MLRFFFWILLIINALLLALNMGYLGDWSMEKHEPGRLKEAKKADKLKLLPASVAQEMIDTSNKKAEERKSRIACLEIPNLNVVDAKNMGEKLAALALGSRQIRTELEDAANNMVYIPSQLNKEGADKKAAQLQKLGISDFYIIQDQTPLRWGISLGVFKTPEAAKAHLASLVKAGVSTAKIAPRSVVGTKVSYRLLDLNLEEKKAIDLIKDSIPSSEVRECKPATSLG